MNRRRTPPMESTAEADSRRRGGWGRPLPFQFQIPLVGGAGPGIAFPIGGGASPFALTLPLGSPAPTVMPVMPVAMAAAPPPRPADPPVLPEEPAPLPGLDADQGRDIGARLLEAVESLAEEPASPAALMGRLLQAGLPGDARPQTRPSASAAALFRTLAGREPGTEPSWLAPWAVLARPGTALDRAEPRPGDLMLRVAPGEGWGQVGVVASPGLHPDNQLGALGLRSEGYPRPEPGAYVHVAEPGPRHRPASMRFARRLCDRHGQVLPDTLLLRLRSGMSVSEATDPPDAQSASLRRLQVQLNRVHADLTALGLPGLPDSPLPEDGRAGPKLARALLAFQQQAVDDPAHWTGADNAPTRAALDRLAPVLAQAPAPIQAQAEAAEGGEPVDIRWVQEALNRLMSAGLATDGVAGPRTSAAIRAFQRSRGLAADGVVGPRTLAALRDMGSGSSAASTATRCAGIPERSMLDGFAFGRAEVPPQHEPTIRNLAACILESQRSRTPITRLTLVGHTDPVGTDQDNNALGQRRAEAVRDVIFAAIGSLGGDPRRLSIDVQSRGEREQVPGDPPRSRRVEVRAPFAYPQPRPQPPPQPAPQPVPLEPLLRRLLSASMLLAANPAAPFTPVALPAGRQSGSLWGYSLGLVPDGMRAENVTCLLTHAGGHTHPMPVLQKAIWEAPEIRLPGARARLPLRPDFLLGSFSASSGGITRHGHPIWRLESRIDIGTAAVFAFDLADPAAPRPVRDAAMLEGRNGPIAIVCCELVLCRTRADFEPLGVLDAARIYPLTEVVTNRPATETRAAVRLHRPSRSPMDHIWANGGRHLVGLFTDRNPGSQLAPPIWPNMFDYVLKDAGAATRSWTMVDPARSGPRRDTTHRQVLDSITETLGPTVVEKEPRQGDFDNVHIAPQMLFQANVPLLGSVPPTPVSMAPICAHDCFHMHWRWSRHFTAEPVLGWGPSGPYTQAGAPMVPPNQTVLLDTTAGLPHMRYEARATTQPPGEWMVMMPHGAAYAIAVRTPESLVEGIISILPPLQRETLGRILRALASRGISGGDAFFAFVYFVMQFHPALRSSPRLRPLDRVVADVAALAPL